MRSFPWLPVLVLFVGLGIGRDASAGAKMDWSEYLEPAGSRTPVRGTPTQRLAKTEKAKRSVAKKQTAKSGSKKVKRSARTRRRH